MFKKLHYLRLRPRCILVATLFLSLASISPGLLAEDRDLAVAYTGLWLTEDNETVIEISKCKQSLCGQVAGFNSDQKSDAEITENEKQMIKDLQLICSTDILGGLLKQDKRWSKGWIYDFETDKKYALNLQLIKGVLKVRAYEGSEAFGESFLWKKVGKVKFSCADILKVGT